LSPARKHTAQLAGTLTGPGKEAAAAAAAQQHAGEVAVAWGFSNFGSLLAGIASQTGLASQHKQTVPAEARQQQQQQQPAVGPHGAAADPALGDASLAGLLGMTQKASLLGMTQGASLLGITQGAAAHQGHPTGEPAPQALRPGLADLTFDFGSLLGLADAPPSWLGPDAAKVAGVAAQPAAGLGDRPFAALFSK
jgi:hypothetical protein